VHYRKKEILERRKLLFLQKWKIITFVNFFRDTQCHFSVLLVVC
jgi:hypothetical protein